MIIRILKFIKRILISTSTKFLVIMLNPVERIILRLSNKNTVPVVFIIGAPRSGTSLLYELLVRRYKFSYISNLAQMMSSIPVSITKFGSFFITQYHKQKEGAYNSKYGSINGYGAPSEGGCVWNRWIPETYYLDESHADKIDVKSLRQTISGFSSVMRGPFLNKNVMHSVHMRLLNILFPGCLFIHINREIKSNVRSILRAHAKVSASKEDWFSVKPKEYKKFKNEDIVLRSVAQVKYVHENINEDAMNIGDDRVLKLDYESLCKSPEKILSEIYTFLQLKGVDVGIRNDLVPDLSMSPQRFLSDDLEKRMDECIDRLS